MVKGDNARIGGGNARVGEEKRYKVGARMQHMRRKYRTWRKCVILLAIFRMRYNMKNMNS